MMNHRTIAVFFAAALLTGAGARQAFGQGAATGSISGRVTDPADAAVPNAAVRVINSETGSHSAAATTSDGFYVIRFLQPGRYTVEVSAQGFQKTVQPNVVVAVAGSPTVNLKLSLGSLSQTITVRQAVGLVELQNSDRSAEIDSTRMANTPSQGRNIMGLAWSAPGLTVTSNAKSFTPYDNSGSTGISINGGQPKSNEMVIDGVPNRGGTEGGLFGTIPTQESVAEMKVITNAYSAEYGRTTGGVINVTTKSGTNQFHGEVYEYNRSTGLAANQFERNLAGAPILPVHFNTAGGVISGPAIRDRLFFTFETSRLHTTSRKSYIGNVPTALERTGDFSQSYALVKGQPQPIEIFDPWSTRYDAATGQYTRTSFLAETGANAIPASRISPVANALFSKFIPLPNAQGVAYTNANNYVPQGGTQPRGDLTTFMPRVDYNINDNTRFTFRYIRNNFNSYDVPFYPNAADLNVGFPFTRANHNISVDFTRTISPTSVLDIRVGLQRYLTANQSVRNGAGPADLGFNSQFVSQTPHAFPVFRFGGGTFGGANFSGAGSSSGNFNPDQINNLDVAWSKITGRHSLKIGGQERLERVYSLVPGNNAGAFSFSPTDSSFNPQINDPASGSPLASFLLGVGNGSIDLNSAPARQSLSTALYVQDDIKISSRLTINAGLRWDYTGPMTDRYNAMTGAFDANAASPLQPPGFRQLTGGLTFPGVNGQTRGVYDAAHTNFGPRLGFAYALNSKTALRAGWGLFYGPIWYDPGSAGFSQSTPWVSIDPNLIPLNLLTNPFPNGLIPPVGAGKGLATNIGTGISFIDPHTREPRSQQFSFEIQRELPWGMRASAGYVLNKVDRLPVTNDLNAWTLDQLALGAAGLNQHVANPFGGLVPGFALNQATTTYGQLIRPYPQFTSVVEQNIPIGSSRYDGLQLYLLKHFSRGLSFSVAYTVSKEMEQTGYQYPTDPNLEKHIGIYDIPQMLVLNGSWELPFGRGQLLATRLPSVWNRVVGGWQFNYMIRLQKGMPFQFPANVMPVAGVDPADVPGGQNLNHWINPSAYVVNNNPYIPRRWSSINGNLRRPPVHNFDLGITKNNKITERVNFQIMGLFINAFNTPQFWDGPTSCSSPAQTCFGQIAGYNTQSNLPRQIQLAGRVTF
ncbi:MAG: carboxypeptidase regulatory-like domain-containing protein [Bryobacterales bacterium]|nr:carboxypeptidase regulatory-like domain-containing protein [Bryobacterales bacterium]